MEFQLSNRLEEQLREHFNEIEWISIKDLKLLRNPKIHPKDQVDHMVESIRRYGFVDPCIVSADNTLLGGYCRLEAAKVLNLDKIKCVRVNLSAEEYMTYILSEGRIAEEASWDYDELINWYLEATSQQKEYLVGWDPAYLEDLLRWREADSDVFEAPHVPQPASTSNDDHRRCEVVFTCPMSVLETQRQSLEADFLSLCMKYEGSNFEIKTKK